MSEFQMTPAIERAVRDALQVLALVWPTQFRIATEDSSNGATLVELYGEAIVERVRIVTPEIIRDAAKSFAKKSLDFGPKPAQLAQAVAELSRKIQENAVVQRPEPSTARELFFDFANERRLRELARAEIDTLVFYGLVTRCAIKAAGDDLALIKRIEQGQCPDDVWNAAIREAKADYSGIQGPLTSTINGVVDGDKPPRAFRSLPGIGPMRRRE